MSYLQRRFLLVLLLLAASGIAACDPEADTTELASDGGLVLSFPDQDMNDMTLPLDPADGFPFRVQVCAPVSKLSGALAAHLWVSSGVGAAVPTGTPVTDSSMVPLELVSLDVPCPGSDGIAAYSGIATLNAPGPGLVTVQAELDGATAYQCAVIGPAPMGVDLTTCSLPGAQPAVFPPPMCPPSSGVYQALIGASATPLALWNGSVPRYSVCAETAATKGTVNLTSTDPSLISMGQMPLSGTLIPGACPTPVLPDGIGVSHVNFDVSPTPPAVSSPPPTSSFEAVVTLAGAPPAGSPYCWSAAVPTSNLAPPVVVLKAPSMTKGPTLPSGVVYTVSTTATTATAGTTPIEGLSVTFASATVPGSLTAAATVATDANGYAQADIVVAYNTPVVVVVSGGGAVKPAVIPLTEAPTVLLSAPAAEGAPQMLQTGELFTVVTRATLPDKFPALPYKIPVQGLSVTFSVQGMGTTVTPATISTDATGTATSYVFVPYSSQALVEVSGGGTTSANVLSTNLGGTYALSAPCFVDQNMAVGMSKLYEVTTRLTLSGTQNGVEGITVNFASPTMGITFIPASATTDANGVATSYVVVPSSGLVPEVNAAGAFATGFDTTMGCASPGPPSEPPVLQPTLVAKPVSGMSPDYWSVTATVEDKKSNGVNGVSVAFSVLAGSATADLAPATVTTATATDPTTMMPIDGQATTYVSLLSGTPVVVVATLGSVVAVTTVGP